MKANILLESIDINLLRYKYEWGIWFYFLILETVKELNLSLLSSVFNSDIENLCYLYLIVSQFVYLWNRNNKITYLGDIWRLNRNNDKMHIEYLPGKGSVCINYYSLSYLWY